MEPEEMQRIAEILGLGEVHLIEPSFALLPDTTFTAILEELEGSQARLLIDQNSNPLCMAVCSKDAWIAGCFHLRTPTSALIARFEDRSIDGKFVVIQREGENLAFNYEEIVDTLPSIAIVCPLTGKI